MSKSRGWCFTINNYTDEDIMRCVMTDLLGERRYIICGFERGEVCNTPHIQGYIHFENAVSFDSVRDFFPNIKLFEAKATGKKFSKRWTYCKKDCEYWEEGECPAQGKRSDLAEIAVRAEKGESIDNLRKDYPAQCMMYSKHILALTRRNDNKECQVYIYKGEDIIKWTVDNCDSYLVVTDMRDLFEYTNEAVVIFTCCIPATELNMMARNMPILVRNGFETRKLLPPIIVVDDVFFSRNSTIVDLVEFLKDDTPWHTSALGNSDQSNIVPGEISIGDL